MVFSTIINNLTKYNFFSYSLIIIKVNKDIIIVLKPSYPFYLVNSLLYNYNINKKERLIIPKIIVFTILREAYNNKYYFLKDYIVKVLDRVYFFKKRY